MMFKILSFVFIVVIFTSFNTGEPVATLECKSESGRTTFKAVLPECSYLESAEFSIDGSKYEFGINDFDGIIFEPDTKIFTIYLETKSREPGKHRFIRFWAIPDTFKKTKSELGPGSQFHDRYEFRAKIYGTEPRFGFENNSKTIELICTLNFEL